MSEENLQRVDHPRGGHGFVNTENRLIYPEGAMKPVPPGICPKCESVAPEWCPPMNDPRYANRVETLREIHGLDETGAHRRYLKDEGGFIARCPNCQTAFWVPASVAKVKE